MQLEELLKTYELSQRSFNLCIDNNIITIKGLIEHFIQFKSFKNFRNCGEKSNNELIEICLYYLEEDEYKELLNNHNTSETQMESSDFMNIQLSRIQREIINTFIEVNTNHLSNRSKNAILMHLDNNLKVKNFIEKNIFSIKFNASKIKNVGDKCIPELISYIANINDFLIEVSKTEDEKQLIELKNKYLIQRTFSINNIPDNILENRSIFKLANYLFNNYYLFKERDAEILKECLFIFSNENKKDLGKIAVNHNLTRQRVEGIRKDGLNNLYDKLLFLKNFHDDTLQKYKIELINNQIIINNEIVNNINLNSETNFTKQFITYLIFIYLSDSISLIGNVDDILQLNYFKNRYRHNWSNFYLVDINIASNFNFISFANDVSRRIEERIEETYTFNFKSYLSNFLINANYKILDDIIVIAEKIINEEFELYLDLDDNLVFKRNTMKQVFEYAIEALEEFGVPTKVEKIYELLEFKNPGITKSKDALRGSLQRNNEIIYFGRSSTYGLKKWEKEKENIRGGSMKDLILSFLSDKENPMHIYEILIEIKKFGYETNAKNVITNLKLDPLKQFVIFNQSFIGLKNENYNTNLTCLPKFLGKSITNYVKQNQSITIDAACQYFSNLLQIDYQNMNYIIRQLIENQFVFKNNQNELKV